MRALFALLVLGSVADAQALFQTQPNVFGAAGCTGAQAGCWTNYLRLTDLDGDGKLDVVFSNFGDFFGNGQMPQPLGVWIGDGAGGFTNQSQKIVGGLVKAVREVAIGDIDGDGDLDLYVPDALGAADLLFVNQGAGVFTDEAAARLPGVASHSGAARFADVDDDGDLDLFVADGYAVDATQIAHLYFNDGTGHFSPGDDHLPAMGEDILASDPAWAIDPDDFDVFDADRDGDLDLLINNHNGREILWLNDGTGRFTDASPNVPLPVGSPNKYNPGVCDVDGDGDLDIWIDNSAANYEEQLLINDGTGHFTDETDARVTGNAVGADDNGIVCADLDGDGDFDAVIVALDTAERVLINDGSGHFAARAGVFPGGKLSRLWLELGDVNGDGRLDEISGEGESGDMTERLNLGTAAAPVDVTAPVLSAIQRTDAGVYHFAVRDAAVGDEGPRLQRAFARVTSGGTQHETPATFMGGDLFRVDPGALAGGATIQVCAIDFAGNASCADAPAPPAAPMMGHGGCSYGSAPAPIGLWFLFVFGFAARFTKRRLMFL
jgi:hypothetical protein